MYTPIKVMGSIPTAVSRIFKRIIMTPIAAHKFGESGTFNLPYYLYQVLFLPNKLTLALTPQPPI